ncbi:MAG: hypothetical protein KA170_01350 [Candidatus Promineofilum sp.]|nr:hypothetical protein [Promineifilum sp.]
MTYRSLLRWMPRALGGAYAVFISLFALDMWGTGAGFWNELAGFLVHLLPTYFILGALVIAWRNPRAGGILFIVLATAFGLVLAEREVPTLLLMAMVPTAIGLLFICDGCINRAVLRPRL